jgi:sugar phosphate isomerase/epimerase
VAHQSGWVLSGFADEVDANLTIQIETFSKLGIPGIDLRSVNSVNVLDLEPHQLFEIGDRVRAAGLHIQSIGSPVNKVPYHVLGKAKELDRLKRAIKAAQLLQVKRIRLFTPETPHEESEQLGDAVIEWMRDQRKMAEDSGITLIVENDANYWSSFPDQAKRLFDCLGTLSFRAAFDFANTVLIGFRPMRDWFPWLLPHLDTLHIKDALQEQGTIVPAGEGEGEIAETLTWLIQQGWSGPLTLEPHLQAAGALGGFSGPELFETATLALRKITGQIGVTV